MLATKLEYLQNKLIQKGYAKEQDRESINQKLFGVPDTINQLSRMISYNHTTLLTQSNKMPVVQACLRFGYL